MLNQIGSERREPVKVTFGPAILDCCILTFDETLFIEATLKCLHELLEYCRLTVGSWLRLMRSVPLGPRVWNWAIASGVYPAS